MMKPSTTSTTSPASTAAIANGMRPIHPGEILREEFLTPLNLSAHALAMAVQVPAPRIYELVRERRGVTVDTALRLATYFGTSGEFWMGLQTDYEIAVAKTTLKDTLARIRQFAPQTTPACA